MFDQTKNASLYYTGKDFPNWLSSGSGQVGEVAINAAKYFNSKTARMMHPVRFFI